MKTKKKKYMTDLGEIYLRLEAIEKQLKCLNCSKQSLDTIFKILKSMIGE